MSMSSNHNQIPFDKIEKYVLDKMSPAEKNAFEKQALNNAFLQDAIDGFSENPGSITHFKTKLQRKNKFKFNATVLTILGISIIIGLIWMFKPEQIVTDNSNVKIDNIKPEIDTNFNEIEVLPMALETLTVIHSSEQIKQDKLVDNFKENPIFDIEQYNTPTPKDIDEIKIDETEENEQIETIQTPKFVFPFVYFYDLAVVDYRKYENREQTIDKTTYSFSGVSADKENEDSKGTEMTEKTVKISYMDYLDESMWYFSKGRYKNALKRFDAITDQYKNDLNALFYGGLSNYNLGRFDFALQNFSTITNLGETPFEEEALWYKAKTEIKLGQINKAINDLLKIIVNGGFYSKKAILLLKKIEG